MPGYHYPDQLQTERLITRYLTEADIPLWTEFFQEPEAIEFFPTYQGRLAEECSTEWINRQLTRYVNQQYGMQALIEKETNTFIGQCGLLIKDVNGTPELEVGYGLIKRYWGYGYAPEAAKLFLDYAFQCNLAESVVSTIATGNINSQRVAERNGLVRDLATTEADGMQLYVYRLHKPQESFIT
jgi:RimJ/RimL family protein N-acetyltransferase